MRDGASSADQEQTPPAGGQAPSPFPVTQPDPAEIAEQIEAFARDSARQREAEEGFPAPKWSSSGLESAALADAWDTGWVRCGAVIDWRAFGMPGPQDPCIKQRGHEHGPETDWKRDLHGNGLLRWPVETP